ncbi:MAG: hypothetical protein HGA54_00900 [Actinobacteria bacterium]|nr:hypothetical protein [Actinomycetota bacterium]
MIEQIQEIFDHYGFHAQINKYCEEGTELLEVLKGYEYGETSRDEVLDEIADVRVMLAGFQCGLCITDDEIRDRMEFKINRQIGRIKKEKECQSTEL